MKKLYICALVVKLLVFTSVERVHAFSTAPFEEPGGGTTFFTPDWGTTFGFDEGMFFEPDGSDDIQRPTAYGQIRSFFQTLLIRRSNGCFGFPNTTQGVTDWNNCCADDYWGIIPDEDLHSVGCDPLLDNPGLVVDGPIGNGLLFLLSIAALHFVIVYFRRKAVV